MNETTNNFDQEPQLTNGCFWQAVATALLTAMMIWISSCATSKSNECDEQTTSNVQVTIKDTVSQKETKVDSTSVVSITNKEETTNTTKETEITKNDSVVVVLDQNGNVVNKEKYQKEKEKTTISINHNSTSSDYLLLLREARDSLNTYISKADSLQKELSHKKQQTIIKKAKIPQIFYYSLLFSIITIIFAIIKIVIWLQRRY